MKNYKESDYALNKHSDGIVYHFADGSKFTVTLESYLAENPDKTEDDFQTLKAFSDNDYLATVRDDNAQTKNNSPFDELDETRFCSSPSLEDLYIGEVDARDDVKQNEMQIDAVKQALDKLTDIQRRRYLLYVVGEMSTRKIAEIEGVAQRSVMDSIEWADKKIKNILKKGKK